MAVIWTKGAIADVIDLGRTGETWETIARATRRGARACERCWHANAKSGDISVREINRASVEAQEPSLPGIVEVPTIEVVYEDDPRAVAECGNPKFMPHRFTTERSGYGCSAGYAAYGV